MSKVIVTGGAGFIGSHVVDALIEAGHDVTIIDSLVFGKKEFINKKATFYKKDIRDYASLKKICKGAEAIFHLAADPRLPVSIQDPLLTHEVNVTGTLNVLWAAKENKVGKVIFSSSCTAYGQVKPPFKEGQPTNPVSPYGLHKLIGEKYCALFYQLYGVESVCLRYFNVFGPRKLATGSYPMVIPVFLDQRARNQPMTIVGDGKATRDYVHVSDVARANVLAWQSKVCDGSPINIGSGKQASVNEIARLIGGATVHIPPRLGEMVAAAADNSKARRLLGWKPKISLQQGLEQLKNEYNIKS